MLKTKMTDWLTTKAFDSNAGAVVSWLNTENTGFHYKEITGYFVKLLLSLNNKGSGRQYDKALAKAVNYLINSIEQDGGIEHKGNYYLFDMAVCLSALVRYDRKNEHAAKIKKAGDFLLQMIESQKGLVVNNGYVYKGIWSEQFYIHLTKVSICLYDLYQYTKEDKYLQAILKLSGHPAVFTHKENEEYTHAFCYMLEGLLFLRTKGLYKDEQGMLQKGLEKLARIQNKEHGGLPAWFHNGQDYRTDSTAQAIRLWLAQGPKEYQENIKKGFEFLLKNMSDNGGVYYSERIKDENSCSTMFTLQAMYWQQFSVDVDALV